MDYEEQRANTEESIRCLKKIKDTEDIRTALTVRARVRKLKHESREFMAFKRPVYTQTGPHPDDPLMTEKQIQLYSYWTIAATQGLSTTVYNNVLRDRNKHSNWTANMPFRHIIDDVDNRNARNIGFLLISTHWDIISALIRNDLAFRTYNDPVFEQIVEKHTRAEPTCGIYGNVFVRRRFVDGQDKTHEGRGLSYNEWRNVLNHFEIYLDVNHVESNPLADKVDRMYPRRSDINLDTMGGERKYVSNIDTLHAFIKAAKTAWLSPLDHIYTRDPNDPRLDVPYVRAPWEIGFGVSCVNRMIDHIGQRSTNYLLGLFGAMVKYLYPDVFEMKQYQLLYLLNPKHAPLAEYLMSELTQSYWFQGGLNPTLAGTMAMRGPNSVNAESNVARFAANADRILKGQLIQDSLAHAKAITAKTEQMLEAQRKEPIDELFDKVENTQKEVAEIIKKTEAQCETLVHWTFYKRLEQWKAEAEANAKPWPPPLPPF